MRQATLTIAFLLSILTMPSAWANPPQLWLSGIDPVTGQKMTTGAGSDFLELFQPDAPWKRAASAVKVFYLSIQFINGEPDDVVAHVFADLEQRNIALAVGGLMVTRGSDCGAGIEGYSSPGQMTQVAQRIRKLGGTLRYIGMDEPLWFGHHLGSKAGCHLSINALAQNVARNVAEVKAIFPNVVIGDAEPAGALPIKGWTNEIMQWAAAYQKATGEKLGFFQADVNWAHGWTKRLPPLASRLRQAHIPFGVFYIGNAFDPTDMSWIRHAEERMVKVETVLKLHPEVPVVDSWNDRPSRWLPETKPGTLTYMVDRYLATPTTLQATHSGGRIAGHLQTVGGAPIAHAAIMISAANQAQATLSAKVRIAGIVPQGARKAAFALRLDTECGCSSPVQVGIGTMSYQEQSSSAPTLRSFPHAGYFRADAQHPELMGSKTFTVHPGARFTADAMIAAAKNADRGGYLSVLFLNGDGKEIVRRQIPLENAASPIGVVKTDAAGQFSFTAPARVSDAKPKYTLSFSGSQTLRLAQVTLP